VPEQEIRRTSGPVWALITLRFLLELALFASYVVAVGRLIEGVVGWLTGLVLAVALAVVWGMFLSPRRQVRLPLAARVAIELVLFVGAGVLLMLSGLVVLGVGLIALELLDLGLLQGPDKHAL
jgi:hypothetical protein